MRDLASFSNGLDQKTRQCNAIIETPKGRRNKFDYDPETELFELAKLLPEGMIFPFDFGFIPSTLADDGDPLDLMVLMDEPAHVGCLLRVRLIGVIEAEQTEKGKTKANPRLLAAAVNSYSYENVTDIADVRPSLLDQLEQFFVSYNKLEGRQFTPTGRGGSARAVELIQQAMKAFRKKKR